MEPFSKSYIEKCIQHRDDIDQIIARSRGSFPKGGIESRSHFLIVGDFIHRPNSMDPLEVEQVSAISEYSISSGTPQEKHEVSACVLVPTEEQLATGLKAIQYSVGLHAHGKGPEALLDAYVASRERYKR